MGILKKYLNNVSKPTGSLGKIMVSGMNSGHATLASWGTQFISVDPSASVLDVGCGGGANIRQFLMRCTQGRVDGVDLSEVSVAKARSVNAKEIGQSRCQIVEGSVEALPFESDAYDLVTAYETVYFWPDLVKAFVEAYRVLKPGGRFLITNECATGDQASELFERIIDKMNLYTADELANYMGEAGFEGVVTHCDQKHPWICVIGTKPAIICCPADSSDEVAASEPQDISQAVSLRDAGPKYDNWVPKHMVVASCAGTAVLGAGCVVSCALRAPKPLRVALAGTTTACGAFALWSLMARSSFSYEGERKLSRQIVEGTAAFVSLPQGGTCLDVGCGSGALSIAVARRNPQGEVVGVDLWGSEYGNYSQLLCEKNAQAEGCENVRFKSGDARQLPFDDETFDAVTSNYVYHNVMGANKQDLLRETLRTLKKGGTFAIHDIMDRRRYGDMQAFVQELRDAGFERVELVPTTCGLFMEKAEAGALMLSGSALLLGKK
ncbi:MAG: class I SAM-dependent methyltransferase [Coriobacteriales bacterium]|nr:class I SAM-dependent methyltransferase [Coriobacteriales bacterium]